MILGLGKLFVVIGLIVWWTAMNEHLNGSSFRNSLGEGIDRRSIDLEYSITNIVNVI